MKRAILCMTALIYMLLINEVYSQTASDTSGSHGLEPGEYSVGFRLIEEMDHSRAVTGGIVAAPHPRPIRTYLWYPAEDADVSQPMHFGRYAALADEDIWPLEIAGTLREELKFSRRPLARSLSPEDFDALLEQSVIAIENAEALEGQHPLIVIGQGLYYESPIAFAALSEFLAGRGFVVATSPLVGTNSPITRVNAQDLETQVRDLEFVIAQARRLSFVSTELLGVFGFDMGGMAGLILAMRNPDVDAFMSVDSGILFKHPSGIPAASSNYDPLALRIPWFHVTGTNGAMQPSGPQVESLFEKAIHSDRYLLVANGMGHVDFTSYGLIRGRNEVRSYWQSAEAKNVEGHKAISLYASNFFTAFLMQNQDSKAFLSQEPSLNFPELNMTLEHRSESPIDINYEELVHAIITGEAESAVDALRTLRGKQPDHILLHAQSLRRLVLSLDATWGLTEKAMSVIRFMVELYPTSAGALYMLGESHIDMGDYPSAIEVYTQLLERDPDDNRGYIKPRLEWLNSQ